MLHKLNIIFDKINVNKLKINELDFFSEYIQILEPIATAIDVLQGEKNCYLGYVLPTLYVIKTKLTEISHLKHCEIMRVTILENFEKRFRDLLDIKSIKCKSHILATISIPKFKLKWVPAENDFMEICKSLFLNECENIYISNNKSDGNESSSTCSSVDFFQSLNKLNNNFPESTQNLDCRTNKSQVEALLYLDSKNRNIDSLNQFPIVKKIFLKYNTSLPSSAPVERLLSTGGQILTPRRNRLTDENFEMFLFLKNNESVFFNA